MVDTNISTTDNRQRTYSGISLQERAMQRRRRFIEAGIELFGSLGYHATTVRKLVAVSGLTNRYFYASFDSMEDLQAALTDNNQSSEYKIVQGLSCFFDAMRDPQFAKITHSEVLGISQRVDATYSRQSASFALLLMGYVQDMDTLSITETEKQFIGAALVGAVTHAAIVWVRNEYDQPIEQVVKATSVIFLGTLAQLVSDQDRHS
jgi:AcrR family transcriptional regulator